MSDPARGTPLEVLRVFLRLGLTSFGGPIAHIGYYRAELVVRRKWIDESAFADLLALCQFLPGPASSQVAFSLGLSRAGLAGGLAAWAGFTLPSAAALLAFALGAGSLGGPAAAGMLHGLKLVAVAVVAQAVWGMARTLCPDRQRAAIAAAGALIVLGGFTSLAEIATLALGAAAGLVFCGGDEPRAEGLLAPTVSRRAAIACLAAFASLLAVPPLLAVLWPAPALALFNAFYRSGALVFGGGHVVLPLLRGAVVDPGWLSDDAFLAGYGLAQAVPGPLFSFAAWLGALASPLPGLAGGGLALSAIFLPGMLILAGALPFWDDLRRVPRAQAAMRGINAAVVGLLAAALYDPVWSSAVRGHADFGVALAGFVLLVSWKAPPLALVLLGAAGGALRGQFGVG